MSKQGFAILLVVVAFVAFYGGFLYGRNRQTVTSSTPTITLVPTPTPTNPLGNVKTNPFEDVKFNPFK